MKLRVLDLFSGIGGFSLGLERAKCETGPYDGFETVAFCEIEAFPRKVLAKHWPNVPCYSDVRELTASQLAADGIDRIDCITGGFPCQDISTAGKLAGIGEGTRSGLWSECLRLTGELRPKFSIFENVSNLLSGPAEQPGAWFSRILADLASIGYDAEWENIPASALGAPHRRERIWLMAYPDKSGNRGIDRSMGKAGSKPCGEGCEFTLQTECCGKTLANAAGQRQSRPGLPIDASNPTSGILGEAVKFVDGCFGSVWRIEPDVGRVAHGISNRSHRIAGLGNAVVPQIPELIGNAILEAL